MLESCSLILCQTQDGSFLKIHDDIKLDMSHFGFFTCENEREKTSQQKHDKAVFEMFSGGPRAAGHSQVLSVAWRSKLVGLDSR